MLDYFNRLQNYPMLFINQLDALKQQVFSASFLNKLSNKFSDNLDAYFIANGNSFAINSADTDKFQKLDKACTVPMWIDTAITHARTQHLTINTMIHSYQLPYTDYRPTLSVVYSF